MLNMAFATWHYAVRCFLTVLLAMIFSSLLWAQPQPNTVDISSGSNIQDATNSTISSAAEQVIVLAYHEVVDQPQQAMIPSYAITKNQFVKHLDWLQGQGYQFISIDQLIAAQKGQQRLPEKAVLLSVDDGYQSFYHDIFPILQQRKIPALLSVVGAWMDTPEQQRVQFGDQQIQRDQLLSWAQLKQMQASGWVEIASHSYALHQGILGNPQGNSEPAAVTRRYDAKSQRYENDRAYAQRISQDLKRNIKTIQAHGLPAPRVMVWPYGRYNAQSLQIAKQLGMPISLSLDDGADVIDGKLQQFNRILIESDTDVAALEDEINARQQKLTDNQRPQKIMHVDLDYIYDPDQAQQERNLGALLDRIVAMQVNTVYLQAFSDPDGNGSADQVYFPNRYVPMRTDLFNRVAWQIQTRTQVSRVYAWMPLLAWELPKNNPVAKQRVEAQFSEARQHLNMGYIRLSPYSPQAREVIRGLYQDLAKSAAFNGIIFHDDATLSDYEDASPAALRAYAAQGLPTDLAKIRADDALLQRWTAFKTKTLDDFAMQLAADVRLYQPYLVTARNLYAQVALSAYAENWYAQSLEQSLDRYDFTAIMAMPYMEQVEDSAAFYQKLVQRVQQYPQGMQKTVFELQAVDWRKNEKIPTDEIAATIANLYQQGVIHVGYYPDDPIANHPETAPMRKVFEQQPARIKP